MANIAVLLIIVLIMLAIAAVNFLAWELPQDYGSFALGTRLTIEL